MIIFIATAVVVIGLCALAGIIAMAKATDYFNKLT